MIREPYNLNPYNTTISKDSPSEFTLTFGGDALEAAQVFVAAMNTH